MVAAMDSGITQFARLSSRLVCRGRFPYASRGRVRGQRGAVLVVGLAILAVMTILGVGSMRSSLLEERMSGNLRQQTDAFEAAEAGVQAALTAIEDRQLPPTPNLWGAGSIGAGCLAVDAVDSTHCARLDAVLADWRGTGVPSGGVPITNFGGAELSGAAEQPRIVIEQQFVPINSLGFDEHARQLGVSFFTVTALGTGTNGQSGRIVQTTIAKVYY